MRTVMMAEPSAWRLRLDLPGMPGLFLDDPA
jgi:hypothetical protein